MHASSTAKIILPIAALEYPKLRAVFLIKSLITDKLSVELLTDNSSGNFNSAKLKVNSGWKTY